MHTTHYEMGKISLKTAEQFLIVLLDWNCRYYSTDPKQLQKNGKILERYEKLCWDFADIRILQLQMPSLCSIFPESVL